MEAWKKARVLTSDIYRLTQRGQFAHDYPLRTQLRRAGISVMLNIAEGSARRTDKEFAQFLFVATGSLAEVKSALYIARDLTYLNEQDFAALYYQADQISRMISRLIRYLRRSDP